MGEQSVITCPKVRDKMPKTPASLGRESGMARVFEELFKFYTLTLKKKIREMAVNWSAQ